MDLSTVRFGVGFHGLSTAPTGDRDMCIMEAVAYMAGEEWSDSPECASPVVSAFLRLWNDGLSNEDRDRLLPAAVWVPRLVGSRGDSAVEKRRAYLALDWLVRVHTPAWFDLTPSLAPHAAALRALPEVVDPHTVQEANAVLQAAWDAASAAAWDASAREAASASAREAAREAASASARDAAWDAAWDAASAAGNATWAAAGVALHPTVETLQQSALDLLDRMLACGEHRREGER